MQNVYVQLEVYSMETLVVVQQNMDNKEFVIWNKMYVNEKMDIVEVTVIYLLLQAPFRWYMKSTTMYLFVFSVKISFFIWMKPKMH